MIQTSEGNLPQGLDAAIRTGLELSLIHISEPTRP